MPIFPRAALILERRMIISRSHKATQTVESSYRALLKYSRKSLTFGERIGPAVRNHLTLRFHGRPIFPPRDLQAPLPIASYHQVSPREQA